ncbi:TetR/AcrR family transcriptional regulator [uncultured Paludibaculum sp.]|uniref:TetR/AcrR family transcriptional regulator n=1 Tax=uncultured Paludibaculum sp. TaxID=1765020 RepID=UPI002AAB03E9|nr:TetR/AcrR family transcriptional regulator [uncultured Paludibaculum sp.]
MGTAERRAREKDELRRRILEAATALFLEQGYESVSMRKIADRIEYAPSTIYLYFKDKVELVTSICFETFAELDRRLEAIRQLGLPPLETLRRSLTDYVDFGLEHPSHYTFVFCTPPAALKDIRPDQHVYVNTMAMATFDRLRVGIKACMDEGSIRVDDVETTAQSAWLFIHGVTIGLVIDCGFPFVDRRVLIETSLDRLIRGLN